MSETRSVQHAEQELQAAARRDREPTSVPTVRHVPAEVERSCQLVEELDKSMAMLRERLEPLLVVRDVQEPTNASPVLTPLRSMTAERIASLNDHLARAITRLDTLREELDV